MTKKEIRRVRIGLLIIIGIILYLVFSGKNDEKGVIKESPKTQVIEKNEKKEDGKEVEEPKKAEEPKKIKVKKKKFELKVREQGFYKKKDN